MSNPVVTVGQGPLKGLRDVDIDGNEFLKFLGIPYAQPPVGSLRFKAPQPAKPWNGVLDATQDSGPCLSVDFTGQVVGDENCLFLNVYTRQLPKAGLALKPVMVFIHGGGFTLGSNSEDFNGPHNLMSEDVVLVAINYRLGIFGFMSSDDISLDVPGNAGLKDQTLALKWVQDNIINFNGDPKNVTIFGISAGGASVHFQVISPSAKGLFHKAIAQSGSVFSSWAWGQKNMAAVARALNENVSTDREALDILMSLSGRELFELALKIPDVMFNYSTRRPFGPVIEKPNPTAFLTENPLDLLSSGRFNQVPLILGCTSNEGLVTEFKVPGNETNFIPASAQLADVWFLDPNVENSRKNQLKSWINDFYFKDGATREVEHKIYGDVCFLSGVVESAKLAAKKSRYPVYFYIFSYETPASNILLKLVGADLSDLKGVPHGGDQGFLLSNSFGSKLLEDDPQILQEVRTGIKKVTKIWTDFARTGTPHERWEPVSHSSELKYFDIQAEPELKVNPFPDRVAFWERVYENISKIDVSRDEVFRDKYDEALELKKNKL